MPTYSAVVLGCGPRGRAHAKSFAANADRFELRGLCDLDAGRMDKLAEELNTPPRQYTDAAAMLAAEKPDVFCFATQPNLRLALVELAIRHKVKAIAYEKPMATTLNEAKKICDLCRNAGVKQIVCHQHKYGGHWRKVKELIESGALGQVRTIHATSKGWYFYYITHLVDYTLWLNGGHPAEWIAGHIHGRGKLSDSHPSPDYVMGQVAFTNGVRAFLECGPLAPTRGQEFFWYDAGATVVGTEGWAEVIVGGGWRALTKSSGGVIGSAEHVFRDVEDTIPHVRDLADWLDDETKVHPSNGDVSYRGFEISLALIQSALDRKLVKPPVDPSVPITERMSKELPESE
jgi:predicted dehydrogenase